jgi:hypothetical protein
MPRVAAVIALLVATVEMSPVGRVRAADCGALECGVLRASLATALAGVGCAPEPLATSARDRLAALIQRVDQRAAAPGRRGTAHRPLTPPGEVEGGLNPFVYPGFDHPRLRQARLRYCRLVRRAGATDLDPACATVLEAPCPARQ